MRCKDHVYQVESVLIQERRGSQSRLGFYTGEDIDMETARWEKGKGGGDALHRSGLYAYNGGGKGVGAENSLIRGSPAGSRPTDATPLPDLTK